MSTRLTWLGMAVAVAAAIVLAAVQLPRTTLHGPEKRTTVGSLNWAGVASAGVAYQFNDASASWTVPAVSCGAGETSYSIAWVGLDGLNSQSVEQVGTESSCELGVPVYRAWYELYPAPPVFLAGVPVRAGDVVAAAVRYQRGQFQIHIADGTHRFGAQVADVNHAARSSAEAIVEAPVDGTGHVLAFAHISPVVFTTATVGGRPVQAASVDVVEMVAADGSPVALTTLLAPGFVVSRA